MHHLDFSVLKYYFLGQVTSSSAVILSMFYTTYHARSAAVEDQDYIILVFEKKRQEKEEFGGSSTTTHQTEYPQAGFPPLTFSPKLTLLNPKRASKPDTNQLLNKRQLRKKINFRD